MCSVRVRKAKALPSRSTISMNRSSVTFRRAPSWQLEGFVLAPREGGEHEQEIAVLSRELGGWREDEGPDTQRSSGSEDGKSVELTASELALFIEGCELIGRRCSTS
jgi:hypothetical protein